MRTTSEEALKSGRDEAEFSLADVRSSQMHPALPLELRFYQVAETTRISERKFQRKLSIIFKRLIF